LKTRSQGQEWILKVLLKQGRIGFGNEFKTSEKIDF